MVITRRRINIKRSEVEIMVANDSLTAPFSGTPFTGKKR